MITNKYKNDSNDNDDDIIDGDGMPKNNDENDDDDENDDTINCSKPTDTNTDTPFNSSSNILGTPAITDTNNDDNEYYIATNLFDKQFTLDGLKDLYKSRWNTTS